MQVTLEFLGSFVDKVDTRLKEKYKDKKGLLELNKLGLEVYFRHPRIVIKGGGTLLSVSVEYELGVMKWGKKHQSYNVIYDSTAYYVLGYDVMSDNESVETISNYFIEILTSLSQRVPEIEFLNRKQNKKGA